MLTRFDVDVTLSMTVDLDTSKFTPEFMAAYKRHFQPFETIEDHVRYLATAGVNNDLREEEGYPPFEQMGIDVSVDDWEAKILEQWPINENGSPVTPSPAASAKE